MPNDKAVCYVATQVGATNGVNLPSGPPAWIPFGYPSGVQQQAPKKVTSISGYQPLSDVWMLGDTDKISVNNPTNNWYSYQPDQPVHGSVRDFLYFDNHISTRKVGTPGTY